MNATKKTIFISAAEASSDLHGAELVKKINELRPGAFQFVGVGGKALAQAGQERWVNSQSLLSMGFLEVLGRLPKIWKILGELKTRIEETRPDLMIFLDYPDFHFKLTRNLSRGPGARLKKIYYIPPKVWVWRSKRVQFLKDHFAKVLCIFPFEESYFSAQGLSQAKFVGNPLLDELPLQTSREKARSGFDLKPDALTLCLMLGSRPAEWKYHFDLGIEAAIRIAAKLKHVGKLGERERLQVLIPVAGSLDGKLVRKKLERLAALSSSNVCEFRVLQGQSGVALRASDFALIKSGTSTLEAALMGTPHVVFYRTNRVSWWIFKYLIRYKGPVALTNLVAQAKEPAQYWAPEFLGPYAKAEALAHATYSLWSDSHFCQDRKSKFQALVNSLSAKGGSPSECAAREVLQVLDGATS